MIPFDARVLVCLINQPRDLETARWEHWYRIPVRTAPKEYLAEYVAFYLTSAFGDERWSIQEYAEVRGHELARRVELVPSEPNHARANDVYYKLQLGPLQRLARPIPSLKWRRITFIQTTGERLNHALEISELVSENAQFVKLMERADGLPPDDED